MADAYVYAPGCTDFDNIGLCGSLTPTSITHNEIKNGMSEIEIIHPIDEMGKWSYLNNEYIVVAEVPVRQTPEIADGTIVTTIERWNVRPAATKTERKLYSKSSGGKTLTTLKANAAVTVVSKGETRYKIKTSKYTGWIVISALENQIIETIPSDPNAIQTAVPPWSIRPQRFRIYSVETNTDADGNDYVDVLAKHIFYDHKKNVTTYTVNNPTCSQALAGLIAGCSAPNDLIGTTNMLDRRAGIKWERVGFTDALLAPDTGLVNLWDAEIVRDNEEFVILKDAGMNRGVRIEYGKNLIGVEMTVDYSEIVTRYIPIGQNSKGGLLMLTAGTYYTDHGTIVIPSGQNWVAASNDADYAIPHIEPIDFGSTIKAAGTSDADVKDAREALIDAVLNKFEDEQPNYPKITLKVDFVQLGDTDEFAQYKELENVYLYDWVRVWHPEIGVDILAQVTEYEWDAMLDRPNKITLGNVSPQNARGTLPMWKLPSTIPGTRLGPAQVVEAGPNINIRDGIIEISLPGSEEGEYTLVILPDGTIYAPGISSPNLAKRIVSSGVFTVGTGGDFSTLDEAFDLIENGMLSGDITLKLLQDDPGGILRGVTGGYDVLVTAANMLNKANAQIFASAVCGVSGAANANNGITVTATATGTYLRAAYYLCSVADLGLDGKQLTVRCGGFTAAGTGASGIFSIQVRSKDHNTWYQTLYETAIPVDGASFTVPAGLPLDAVLELHLFVSKDVSAAVGASVEYTNIALELGDSVQTTSNPAAQVSALTVKGCKAHARLFRLTLPNRTDVADSDVTVHRCELYGATGLNVDASRVMMRDNTGSCTQAVFSRCSQVVVEGTAPGGTYDGKTIDTTGATISGSGTAPTTQTKTLTSNLTGSYVSSGWISDNRIRQGYTSSRGRHRGYMRFDMSQIPTGATITGLKLTLKRDSSFGVSSGVTIKAYGSTTNAKSGAPALSSSGYVIGSLAWGKSGTFDLPAGIVSGFASGSYKAIVLYSDDTSVIDGRTYSDNFAGFDGTDATAPKLAVTYTV